MKKIVQILDKQGNIKIAKVQEPYLIIIKNYFTVYDLAHFAIQNNLNIVEIIEQNLSDEVLDYDQVYLGKSEYSLILPIHHPIDVRFCMVSGTGLTHKASAENRQKMHDALESNSANDSIKMYQIGVEGGKPENGEIGAQPEWFYKGNGSVLRAHNEVLSVPNYGNDGGEEPEIATIYINDKIGVPHRIGYTIGNEFSDHVMEKKNYLYLAPSKIRNCAIGPELILAEPLKDISGTVSIIRKGQTIWQKDVKTGEDNMCHSLQNLEYHHFKYDNHRIPGDLHIHFLGTQAFSFGAGLVLENDDQMVIDFGKISRPLINYFSLDATKPEKLVINQI